MATDTAVSPARATKSDPTRRLWQIPLFLASLCFFVATWKGWVLPGTDSAAEFELHLASLRTAYERIAPERDELNSLLKDVAADIEKFPELNQQAHFALGSGYSRMAEITANPEETRGYWLLAQQHFSLVDVQSLAGTPDESRFRFRRAKVRAAVGLPDKATSTEIQDLINLLHPGNVFGEEPGEALRLQAELALRLTPPDEGAAREALLAYLRGGRSSTPAINLQRATLKLGEILFHLKELERAKEFLKHLAPDAPPELYTAAKVLLGRVYMAEGDWRGAMLEWEAVRRLPNLTPPNRLTTTYYLGVCKLKTNEPDVAMKLLEEAAGCADGPETPAAAIRLAEIYLKITDKAKHIASADLLVRAMKGITGPKDLRSRADFSSIEVPAVFELAVETLSNDKSFESALKVVVAFHPVAEAGQDREKRAKVLAAWAAELKQSGGEFAAKAKEAAKEYVAFADSQPASSARAETLRNAARMFRLSGDVNSAIETLQTAAKLAELPDTIAGPVWVDLADCILEANRLDEVWPVLNKAMAASVPVSTKVRLQLARHFSETHKPEFCRLALMLYDQIEQQTSVSQAEQEYHELALVEGAHEYVRIRDFLKAESKLRRQLLTYPTGTEAPLGQLLLGVCLLQLAAVPPPTAPTPIQATNMRNEALKLFHTIVTDIDAKQKKVEKLNDRDSWLRIQAALRILQTYQQLKNYSRVISESSELIDRYRGTVEQLIILSLVYDAWRQQGKTQLALETWTAMKKLFDELPPSLFTAKEGGGEYSREYWEKVWFTPERRP